MLSRAGNTDYPPCDMKQDGRSMFAFRNYPRQMHSFDFGDDWAISHVCKIPTWALRVSSISREKSWGENGGVIEECHRPCFDG